MFLFRQTFSLAWGYCSWELRCWDHITYGPSSLPGVTTEHDGHGPKTKNKPKNNKRRYSDMYDTSSVTILQNTMSKQGWKKNRKREKEREKKNACHRSKQGRGQGGRTGGKLVRLMAGNVHWWRYDNSILNNFITLYLTVIQLKNLFRDWRDSTA